MTKIQTWEDLAHKLNFWKGYITGDTPIESKMPPTEMMNITMAIRELIQKEITEQQAVDNLMTFVESICKDIIYQTLKNLKGNELFNQIGIFWGRFKFVSQVFDVLFSSLNSLWLKSEKTVKVLGKIIKSRPIQELCLYLFRNEIFVKMKNETHNQILDFINRDRKGDHIEPKIVKGCVDLFVTMSSTTQNYYEQLEQTIIKDCQMHYANDASNSMKQDSVPEFVLKCKRAYDDEKARVSNYLQPRTEDVLLKCLDDTLLQDQCINFMFLNSISGVFVLMQANKVDDLRRMYDLVSRADLARGIIPLSKQFYAHVYNVGTQVMLDQETVTAADLSSGKTTKPEVVGDDGAKKKKKKPKKSKKNETDGGDEDGTAGTAGGAVKKKGEEGQDQNNNNDLFIERILDLYRLCNILLVHSFNNNSFFHDEMGKAFRAFLNKAEVDEDALLFPHLLAVYADKYIRRMQAASSSQDMSIDSAVVMRLTEIVNVLAFVHDKMLFTSIYRKLLAKRLLDVVKKQEGMNTDLEKSFFGLMKRASNTSTVQLEQMYADFESAHADQAERTQIFNGWLEKQHIQLPILFESSQLKFSAWPIDIHAQFLVPPEVEACINQYNTYYNAKYPQQMLVWDHTHGFVTLKVRFSPSSSPFVNVTVTTVPVIAMTLLKFNEQNPDGTPNMLLQNGGIVMRTLQDALGLNDVLDKAKSMQNKLDAKVVVQSLYQKRAQLVEITLADEPPPEKDEKGNETIPEGITEELWKQLSANERRAARIPDDAIIRFNTEFACTRGALSIPLIDPLSQKDIGEIKDDLKKMKPIILEASIVRIMKAELKCHITRLMTMLKDSIKMFEVKRRDVLMRIEDLIGRDYMKRDDQNPQEVFHYVA